MKHDIQGHDGTVIGTYIDRTQTFYQKKQGSKHRLRQPPAWAIDTVAYNKLVALGCQGWRILDTETNVVYATSLLQFSRVKKELDRGYGKQYYMDYNLWRQENPLQPALL